LSYDGLLTHIRMPKPVYIVCAQSVSLDKSTNLLSLFHVLEGFTLRAPSEGDVSIEQGEEAPAGIPTINLDFVGVATWEREEQDSPETEFDFVVQVIVPWEGEARTVNEGKCIFAKPFQRFMARMVLGIPKLPEQSGNIRFVSKIRRLGSQEWQSQEYRIPIKLIANPEAT